MPELKFFDVRNKKKFTTDDYVVKTIKGRNFAVTTDSPSGKEVYRIVPKNFKK